MASVVLLHGLGRTSSIMLPLTNYLITQQFACHNINYPSTAASISELMEMVHGNIASLYHHSEPLHFVGHSMGSIIIRELIRVHRPPNLGRVVMIAPPNQGTPLVDFLRQFKLYRKIYGPAGQQLGTKADGIYRQLVPIDYPVGVIAGNKSVDWFFSRFILKGDDDGKVPVSYTVTKNLADHIVLPVAHRSMVQDPIVMREVGCFLKTGRFERRV